LGGNTRILITDLCVRLMIDNVVGRGNPGTASEVEPGGARTRGWSQKTRSRAVGRRNRHMLGDRDGTSWGRGARTVPLNGSGDSHQSQVDRLPERLMSLRLVPAGLRCAVTNTLRRRVPPPCAHPPPSPSPLHCHHRTLPPG